MNYQIPYGMRSARALYLKVVVGKIVGVVPAKTKEVEICSDVKKAK